MSKSKNTPKKLSQVEWPTDLSAELLFLATSETSEVNLGFVKLFTADSRAKTLASQELEKVWAASEADYSLKLSDLQKKFDRLLSSLKMCQPLELGDLTKLSKHFPKYGMTVGGFVYLPQALALPTNASVGSYLPTPTASSYGSNGNGIRKGKQISKKSLNSMAATGLWPTPQARDFRSGDHPDSLRAQRKNSQGWSRNLNDAVLLFPTPRASEAGREPAKVVDRGSKTTLCEKLGGKLNPTWVEWLMGLPLGWTELKPLEMGSSLCK
jgi:hypothetical protein